MKIEFIKKHPSGIAKGRVVNAQLKFAKRMIEEGFAKEVKAKKEKK